MNRKQIICSTLLALLLIVFTILVINSHNNSPHTVESIYDEYNSEKEEIIATIDDVPIPSKEVCLIKYFYNDNDALDKTVEHKTVLKVAENDGFSLSESDLEYEKNYIKQRYENSSINDNSFYMDFERCYIEMVTVLRYKGYVEKLIQSQEFETDNSIIMEKYNQYKDMYTEWESGNKEDNNLYKEIWLLREEIAQGYIDYQSQKISVEQ